MLRLSALIVLASSLAFSASPRAVAPRKYHAPGQEKMQRALRQAMPSLRQPLAPLVPHVLPPLDKTQLLKNANKNGRVQVGIHRTVVPEALQLARRDGQVWRLAIQSPGASALRLHFTRFNLGGGQVWIHDGSGDEERVLGPYLGRGVNGDGDFWSDTVFSETVSIEYQPENGKPVEADVPFAISELSHQFSDLAAPGTDKSAAASCELDVNCYSDWATTATGVARISFEEPDGTYVCSGTLLSTRNHSNVPYFLTANHCISNDTVARTLQAVWFFQKDQCNGTLPNRNFPRSLGSTLVVTGDRTQGDFTLLKLSSIPDGVTFQGWDPTEQAVGTAVTVIHHPAGDYKRIAFGNVVTNSRTPANFYSVFYSSGLTEGGSSGSGIFSAPGVLVGTLSNGPKADTAEGYCQIIPFADNYGKFSGYYSLLRDILEERGVGNTPTPPASSDHTLTSGTPATFNLGPVTNATLFSGSGGFTINVPQGATKLDVVVRTTTPGADVDLFVRFGQDITIGGGNVVADYASATDSGNEQVSITAGSNPPLRAGTYYIALGLFTTNTAVTGTITATVTTGGGTTPPPPSGGATVLTSGTASTFNLGPVTGGTLFNGNRGFTINVPDGATRLDIVVRTTTPNADVDLFVRFGQDITISSGSPVSDYSSQGDTGNEQVTVTGTSSPPLRAGTYYIALALFTSNIPVTGTITATVTTGGGTTPPPPSGGGNVLTSGTAATFNLGPVTGGTLFNGNRGFTINVPQGATRLDIVVRTTTPNADVDMFVRFGQDIAISSGNAVSDYSSQGDSGNEQVTVSATSNPPLRAGTYYIALALFTSNIPVTGTITATVTTGGGTTPPPPSGGSNVLTSGSASTFNLGPVTSPTLFSGNSGFTVNVPQGATRLDVVVRTTTPGADVDLYVRFGQDITINAGTPVADYASQTDSGNEQVSITASSNPPLRPGTYYIALGLFTTNVATTGTITATVTTGGGSTPPPPSGGGGGTVLTSGTARNFSLPSVNGGTLFNGSSSFTIDVPQGATRLDVKLSSSTPGADLDLFVRYGSDTAVQNGSVTADYSSTGATADESISITPSSSPALRAGTYYISVASFTFGVSINATVTATVTTGGGTTPPPSGGAVLTSGRAQTFTLGPVTGGTLFRGPSSYTIVVPQGATSLDIVLHTVTPNVDMDLFARYNQDTAVSDGSVAADYSSTGSTGEERITITPNSSPQLRAGTYYISLAMFTPNVQATGTVTATVNTSTTPPPPANGPTVLSSGMRQMFSFNAVTSPTLFTGTRSYAIDVPANATRLDIQLETATPGADLDLFVSFGKDNNVSDGSVVADFSSTGPDGNERISITPSSSPGLQAGRYYISLAVYSTGTATTGSLLATVSSGGGGTGPSPSPTSPTVLTLGTPAKFSLPAVTSPTLFTGNYSFQVQVPPGSTSMRVQVFSDNAAVDVDVYARYGADNAVDDSGNVITDYASEGPTGNETLTVSTASSPPLRPGLYYLSLGLFSRNVVSGGAIVVTVERGAVAPPTTTGTPLTSGVSAPYSLPAVSSPTLFTGINTFRITVGSQNTALRVSVRNNPSTTDVDLFVRLGQEPAVSNGRVVADFVSASDGGNEDVVIQGASLQAGIYYISLALYSTGVSANGTITATLSTAGGGTTELELVPVTDMTLGPKPATDIRQMLPDTKAALADDGFVVKHTSMLKKREPMAEAAQ